MEFDLWKIEDDLTMDFIGQQQLEGLNYLVKDVVYFQWDKGSADRWGNCSGLMLFRVSHFLHFEFFDLNRSHHRWLPVRGGRPEPSTFS